MANPKLRPIAKVAISFIPANPNPRNPVVRMNDDGFISGDAIMNTNTGAKGIPRESSEAPSGTTPMDHKGLIIASRIAAGFIQKCPIL